MFQVKGRNKIGDIESIILDDKKITDVVLYANKYFSEVISIKNIGIDKDKTEENN